MTPPPANPTPSPYAAAVSALRGMGILPMRPRGILPLVAVSYMGKMPMPLSRPLGATHDSATR